MKSLVAALGLSTKQIGGKLNGCIVGTVVNPQKNLPQKPENSEQKHINFGLSSKQSYEKSCRCMVET